MKAVRLATVLLVLALVLALVLSPDATGIVNATSCANIIYVDASRPDDLGNGLTWATAKKYIQSGINIVCSGGTVNVAAGTYRENLSVDTSLDLVGASALTTIIDGGGIGQVMYIASGQNNTTSGITGQTNTISGFTIQNGHIGSAFLPQEDESRLGGPGMPVGGGVYVAYGHVVTLNDCTIRNNTADFLGGGIYNAGQITLNRCTVNGNSAAWIGGGIANFTDNPRAPQPPTYGTIVSNATMTLTNCTIFGNSVTRTSEDAAGYLAEADLGNMPSMGGGVYNGGTANFVNVTIANNSVPASALGGGFANVPLECTNPNLTAPVGATSNFKNTIVANNIPGNGYNSAGEAYIISLGYNLDSENTCGFNQSTDQFNSNPQLGSLQNNGGPTSTCAIIVSSPAFNRGTASGAPATDQRGVARPQSGAYDIGAYELIPAPTVATCSPSQGLQGQCPITVLITGAYFDGATTVSFGPGITVSGFTVDSASQITATICISGAPGIYDVSVTTPGGTGTLTGGFTVISQNQDIGSGSSPSTSSDSGSQGDTFTVELPDVTVQSASISAKTVTPGTPVKVSANIANKGTVNGVKKITLYVNGLVESTQGVTVNSGGSLKVTFNVSRSEPGDYTVYVDGVPAGNFKVEMATGNDYILIFSIALIALALVTGMVMLWRRQRIG